MTLFVRAKSECAFECILFFLASDARGVCFGFALALLIAHSMKLDLAQNKMIMNKNAYYPMLSTEALFVKCQCRNLGEVLPAFFSVRINIIIIIDLYLRKKTVNFNNKTMYLNILLIILKFLHL